MNRSILTRDIYNKTPSGLLAPAASIADARSFSTTSIAATKLDGLEMLNVFKSKGIDPSRSASLTTLIEQTSKLSDAILTAQDYQASYMQLFSALQLRRLVDAVNAIADETAAPKLLAELLNGTLDLLVRTRSKAKDTLWEIELLLALRENGITATIGEPDLILAASSDQVGVACKKIYSIAHFSKTLSGAVKQIQKSLKLGIVAVNIDDLIPANSILTAPTEDIAAKVIHAKISEFFTSQERYLRKYVEPGRAIAVFVSCAALADLKKHKPRFCNFRQTVAWHVPSISKEIDFQFNAILSKFKLGTAYA